MQILTATEHKYMCLIWDHPEGILSYEIYKQFPQTMGSKSSILHKVVQKGCARWEQRGRQAEYFPVISRLEYDQFALNHDLSRKMGHSSFASLFAAFCGKENLSEEEHAKLKNLIIEMQRNTRS